MAPLLLPRAGAAYDPESSPSRARARADNEEPPRGRRVGSCTRLVTSVIVTNLLVPKF